MTACAWDVDCLALGACDAGAPPTPEICDGGATADTGPSAGSRDGATSGSEDASSIGDAGGAGEGGTGGGSSGCGCRVSRSKEVREHVIPVLVATLLIAARRRKRPT